MQIRIIKCSCFERQTICAIQILRNTIGGRRNCEWRMMMSGAMWLVVRSFVLALEVHRSKKLNPTGGVEPGSPRWQARGLASGPTRLDRLCKIALVNCKKPVASRCIINNEWTWLWLLIKSRGDFYKWRAIHTSFTQRKTDVKFAGVPSRTQALVANFKCPIFATP